LINNSLLLATPSKASRGANSCPPKPSSAGITFLGRPYDDARMIRLAYAYEQATHHRRPPVSLPLLDG
jgi:hypothetical protein